ncbi:hypothetical protein HK098_002999 [Nowakowskiella sp. JEL0407]|nr:hypothetical protein HK098_002999 [Nowakowskiella sp. JEL0407]
MSIGNPFESYRIGGVVVPRYRLALFWFSILGLTGAYMILKPKKEAAITYESDAEKSFVQKYIEHHHHDLHKPSLLRKPYSGN